MRFTIELRHLTDERGKPIPNIAVSFYNCDADNVDDAVRLFIKDQTGEILGDLLTFPGFQAVATVRNARGVFTLQAGPSSERYIVR